MRGVRAGLACLALLLAGCGGKSADLSARCTSRMVSGLLRVGVTIQNNTGVAHRGIVYGPGLEQVRYVHPVMRTTPVVVKIGKRARSYPGWVLPPVAPHAPIRVVFQIVKPVRLGSILVTDTRRVQASDESVLRNPNCTPGA